MFLFPSPLKDTPSEWPPTPLTSTHLHQLKSTAKQKTTTTKAQRSQQKVCTQEIKPVKDELRAARIRAQVGILWRCAAQPPLSIVTSLGCSLVWVSRGLTELSSASEPWPGQRSAQRTPFHTDEPRRGQGDGANHRRSVTDTGHPPFCAPQGLSSVLHGCLELPPHCFCYLVTQMEVFRLWEHRPEGAASSLLSARLQTVMAVCESRSERCGGFFTAKMATSSTSTPSLMSTAAQGDLTEQYGASTRTQDLKIYMFSQEVASLEHQGKQNLSAKYQRCKTNIHQQMYTSTKHINNIFI